MARSDLEDMAHGIPEGSCEDRSSRPTERPLAWMYNIYGLGASIGVVELASQAYFG